MVITIDIIQLIFQILIAIALLYMAFFKSYFQEKGKNLATKEDIQEITKKVESIKTGLQFSLEAKLSWRAEEHDALVDYYSKYGAWIAGLTNVSFTGISDENVDRLSEIRSNINALEEALELADNRMQLFVDNTDILSQKGPLKIETFKLHAYVGKSSFEFAMFYLEVKQMKISTDILQQTEPYQVLLNKENDMYTKFKNEQAEYYQTIYPLISSHRKTISDHLKNLIRNNE
jgi:hypothetical protein